MKNSPFPVQSQRRKGPRWKEERRYDPLITEGGELRVLVTVKRPVLTSDHTLEFRLFWFPKPQEGASRVKGHTLVTSYFDQTVLVFFGHQGR